MTQATLVAALKEIISADSTGTGCYIVNGAVGLWRNNTRGILESSESPVRFRDSEEQKLHDKKIMLERKKNDEEDEAHWRRFHETFLYTNNKRFWGKRYTINLCFVIEAIWRCMCT